jgi:hypothetical protein
VKAAEKPAPQGIWEISPERFSNLAKRSGNSGAAAKALSALGFLLLLPNLSRSLPEDLATLSRIGPNDAPCHS